MKFLVSFLSGISLCCAIGLGAGCGGGDNTPLFEPKPECVGASITPLQGAHPMVISFLEIGELDDGFDLDRDGKPDNKLSAIGSLAASAIEDSFDNREIVIPLEFFDFDMPAEDECVKFAIYLGDYRLDRDGDGDETGRDRGDCNDFDKDIKRGAAEVPDNGKDDDCDGLADETDTTIETDAGTEVVTTPSTNTDDADGDGVTIADGDCDDTNDKVKGPSMAEICGDGLDNDCDGNADWGVDAQSQVTCNPYGDTPEEIALDPLGFKPDGSPIIAFNSGVVTNVGGKLMLEAGPSIFSVNIPVTGDLNLDLRISGATIVGEIKMLPQGWALVDARLGGVLDANTMDKVRGLDVEQIGLRPEDSLLDATFANILGPILALPAAPDNNEWAGCRTPDIDVDRDGLEIFCDSDPLDDVSTVDVCVDGNGDVVRDEVDGQGNITMQCTEAVDADGKLRFVDGISIEMNFDTVPTILPTSLPPLN